MISYHDYQRMDHWVGQVRRQTKRDVLRMRRQRLRESQRTIFRETPVVAILGWLQVAHAWFSAVVVPQLHAAGHAVSAYARPAERVLPGTNTRQR